MPISRTNFRAGDRVRGAEWFDEIAGVVGTVVEAVEVRGHDWVAQDLLVRFDRPVIIFDEPQWTFFHSAHNFVYNEPTRRRLSYKQPPPPAYQACEGCRWARHECTCAEGAAVEDYSPSSSSSTTSRPTTPSDVAVEPPRFQPFSGTPHRLG